MHKTVSQHFTPPPRLFLVGEDNQEGRAQLHDSFPVRFRKRITLNAGYVVIWLCRILGEKGRRGQRGGMLIFGSLRT